MLRNQNAIIKDKFVKFVESVRNSTAEDKEGEHEEDVTCQLDTALAHTTLIGLGVLSFDRRAE